VNEEERAWKLLIKDFYADLPDDLGLTVHMWDEEDREDDEQGEAQPAQRQLQIFEVVMAATFAHLRSDYQWSVTPKVADGGADFLGEQSLLGENRYGIESAIKIGGQCRKHEGYVNNVLDEFSSSLNTMYQHYKPTFFVVALSANVTQERIKSAREAFEEMSNLHCHVFDRKQVEAMLSDHLWLLKRVLEISQLTKSQQEQVLSYMKDRHVGVPAGSTVTHAPKSVDTGTPFTVDIEVSAGAVLNMRLWWRPRDGSGDRNSVELIDPAGATSPAGTGFATDDPTDDPLRGRRSLEMVTHSVGEVDLGEIRVATDGESGNDEARWLALGHVRVKPVLRPRFYERPFSEALERLGTTYEVGRTHSVASIGVVGVGGSGKSRLCEEFSLRRRREGASVITVTQVQTVDDPLWVLAGLLRELAARAPALGDSADRIVATLDRFASGLARKAEPAIRAIFESHGGRLDREGQQHIVSALRVLITAWNRQAPLVIHLQDMHWCGSDALRLLQELVVQLAEEPGSDQLGTLFIFEGRISEQSEDGLWSSDAFERFLQSVDCELVKCSFAPDQSAEFVSRLFEDRDDSGRRLDSDLLRLQRELIERIDRAAGGNPFHTLEQVRKLRDQGFLGQSPSTGLLFLVKSLPDHFPFPTTVRETIEQRWRYMKSHSPGLALSVWAAALLDDRVPTRLFARLMRELTPDTPLVAVDATEFLWTGGEDDDVIFRHEHYFNFVREFDVPVSDRERIVDVYEGWFAEAKRPDPVDRLRWARALLKRATPDEAKAKRLLRGALQSARRLGDTPLAQHVAATLLDVVWDEDARSPIRTSAFLRYAEQDVDLSRELLTGDRSGAADRLNCLTRRLEQRVARRSAGTQKTKLELTRLHATAAVRRSQVMFNDREPLEAARIAAGAIRDIERASTAHPSLDTDPRWERLEMEALHSEAVALAISGEVDQALETSGRAVEIARRAPSSMGQHVISTYANILLAREPAESESILRRCLSDLGDSASPDATEARDATRINLGMALVLQAHAGAMVRAEAEEALGEAGTLLGDVFDDSYPFGRYPDAAAAALMLGLIDAIGGDADGEEHWFGKARIAAVRGRQMETLWKANIDLATALHRAGGAASESIRDHAHSALVILEDSLAPYPVPDRSARFELVRAPLAQAVRFLTLAGDDRGPEALARYPALREGFQNPEAAILREDRGGYESHEWLRICGEDYILY
jgi:hypothetical protein